jgi:hypothetical protein
LPSLALNCNTSFASEVSGITECTTMPGSALYHFKMVYLFKILSCLAFDYINYTKYDHMKKAGYQRDSIPFLGLFKQ